MQTSLAAAVAARHPDVLPAVATMTAAQQQQQQQQLEQRQQQQVDGAAGGGGGLNDLLGLDAELSK